MSRRMAVHLIVLLLYVGAAILITWPLVTELSSAIAGFGYGDGYEMAHHIWWFGHALRTGQPVFEPPLLGYPDSIKGVTLWSNPLQFFPAWALALVAPLPLAANVTLLATMALNGLAMYALGLHLTGGRIGPAFIGGLAYMAFPTMQGHLGAGHAGLLVQWPVPLYVYALLRLRETGRRRWILAAGLLFVASTFGHTLNVIYVLMPVTAVYALALLTRREWGALARTAVAVALGMVLLGLFLIPMFRATLGTSAYTDEGGAVRYSADLLAAVTPSFLHPVFGQWAYTHRVLGINLDEGAAYVGVIAGLLALLAARHIPAARWWLGVAVAAYVLSLGPLLKIFDQPARLTVGGYETFVTLPGLILDQVPLLILARTPGRLNFALALAVGALAAYGMAWLSGRLWDAMMRAVVLALATVFILFEYQTFAPFPTTTADVPEAIAALAERDDTRAVFNAPWDHLVAAKEALYLQTAHEQAMIAGHVTRRTPVDPAKLTVLEATFDPALLNEAGADIVIIHRAYDEGGRLFERARNRLGEPTFEDARFAIFETPDSAESAGFTTRLTADDEITDQAESYLYAPADGWTVVTARLSADLRNVVARLDGEPIQRWWLDGEQAITLPLPLTAGYHTLTLAVEPPCPQVYAPSLRCLSVTVDDLTASDFEAGATGVSAVFDGGLRLAASNAREPVENTLPVWLAWGFDAPRSETDIRFVHVVDAEGTLVAQVDGTLGPQAAGTGWHEVVTLELPTDLRPGTYRVYTGWYTYPDVARFAVLSEVEGAADNWVLVGEFRVE